MRRIFPPKFSLLSAAAMCGAGTAETPTRRRARGRLAAAKAAVSATSGGPAVLGPIGAVLAASPILGSGEHGRGAGPEREQRDTERSFPATRRLRSVVFAVLAQRDLGNRHCGACIVRVTSCGKDLSRRSCCGGCHP